MINLQYASDKNLPRNHDKGRGSEGALASPEEFRVSEKRTEREIGSLLLSASSDLKT